MRASPAAILGQEMILVTFVVEDRGNPDPARRLRREVVEARNEDHLIRKMLARPPSLRCRRINTVSYGEELEVEIVIEERAG